MANDVRLQASLAAAMRQASPHCPACGGGWAHSWGCALRKPRVMHGPGGNCTCADEPDAVRVDDTRRRLGGR